MESRLWLQHPPRRQWVLRVTHETNEGRVTVRTWFPEELGPEPPPDDDVALIQQLCERIARAALAGEVEDINATVCVS